MFSTNAFSLSLNLVNLAFCNTLSYTHNSGSPCFKFLPIGGNPSGSSPYSGKLIPASLYISYFLGLNILKVDFDPEVDPSFSSLM